MDLHESDDLDLRERPIYGIKEAAGHLHLAPSTLSTWVSGRQYRTQEGEKESPPVINRPCAKDSRLSFMHSGHPMPLLESAEVALWTN